MKKEVPRSTDRPFGGRPSEQRVKFRSLMTAALLQPFPFHDDTLSAPPVLPQSF